MPQTDSPTLQAEQLALFLAVARKALTTATFLRLRLPIPVNPTLLPTGDPYGLSALASMLPAMHRLDVDGSASLALMQLLGPTVDDLFFSAPDMHRTVVERLHHLLPSLTSLRIAGYTQELLETPEPLVGGGGLMLPYHLSKLVGVEHLQVDELIIYSDELWTSFPPNLSQLTCAGVTCAPPVPASLHQLRAVVLAGGTSSLAALAGMFRSTLVLANVETCEDRITVDCGLTAGGYPLTTAKIDLFVADLTLLDRLHTSGVVSSPYAIVFDDCEEIEALLFSLPVLCSIAEARLDWGGVFVTAEVKLLSVAFPNLETLWMGNSETLNDKTMLSLLPLKKLKSLTLHACPIVTIQGLTFLLTQLPHVTTLNAFECESLDKGQASLLRAMMLAIGRGVDVSFVNASSSSESDTE